jgi:DNA-binding CsgD family transcriptional regulator
MREDLKKAAGRYPAASRAQNACFRNGPFRPGMRIGGGLSQPISLPRRGKRPIVAYPIKLSNLAANALADCQALIVLIDLDKQPHTSETVLQATFHMTPAEARLATRLSTGESLESATETIGIAKETGRNQLKSIFLKLGVKRQSELVAKLSLLSDPP